MLECMSTLGIASRDEASFTEDPWSSAPFDNMTRRLSATYRGITDGSGWERCYGGDPLIDVIVYGYTDVTVSRRDLLYTYIETLNADVYTDELGDLHDDLLDYYKMIK
jgi:hypothetical protein